MNITVITGEKGSGKSTYLRNIISNEDYDGVITLCDSRVKKEYSFYLIKEKKRISCCFYDKNMIFNKKNFFIVNNYFKNIKSKNIIIDEIGWLELKEKGLYEGLTSLLKSNKIENLIISMRFDSYKKLILKYNIINPKIIIK